MYFYYWLTRVYAHFLLLLLLHLLLTQSGSSVQISNVCFWGCRPQHPRRHSSGQRPRWWWYNLLHNSGQRGRKLCHWQPERWCFLIFGQTFAARRLIDRLSVKSHIQFSLIHSCYNGMQWTPSTFKVNAERYWKLILKAVISIRSRSFHYWGHKYKRWRYLGNFHTCFFFLQVQRGMFLMFPSFLVLVTAQFIFFFYPLIRNQWQSLWHLSPNPFNSISQQLLYRSSQSSGCGPPAPLSFVSSFYIPFHPFCVS